MSRKKNKRRQRSSQHQEQWVQKGPFKSITVIGLVKWLCARLKYEGSVRCTPLLGVIIGLASSALIRRTSSQKGPAAFTTHLAWTSNLLPVSLSTQVAPTTVPRAS